MFKKFFSAMSLMAAFAICAVPAYGQALKADAKKSKIEFVGKKPDGKHAGGFKEFSSEANVDMATPSNSTLKIEIKTESMFSDDEKLTSHLKNPDFFDVKKYPTIKFESTKVEVNGEEAIIYGKLTMLDKTVEVKVPTTSVVDDTSLKVMADFKIDRTKWGMVYGKGKIEDEVLIRAELFFAR
jgi:polyisoprenoid-binding protein YceI